jgi:hypothetical protein
MRDYWLVQYLLAFVGWSYIIGVVIATALALKLPKTKQAKVWATVIVIGLSAILPLKGYQGYRKEQQGAQANKARLDKAQALFAARCKTAGEKIYRTVEGVDGVLLTNIRPSRVMSDDQFAQYDPYGYEGGGDEYIKSFLAGNWKTCVGKAPQCPANKKAFDYVDIQSENFAYERFFVVDKATHQPFLPGVISIPELVKGKSTLPLAKYAVTWIDVSTDEDRKNWIAGGRISILDRITNEIVAERTGYLMDSGLGNTAGSRSPWSWARHYTQGCPTVDEHNFVFVRKVLKPNY